MTYYYYSDGIRDAKRDALESNSTMVFNISLDCPSDVESNISSSAVECLKSGIRSRIDRHINYSPYTIVIEVKEKQCPLE